MAKVRVVCPNPDCRRSGEVDEALLGKRGRCKKCGTSIVFAPSDGDSPAPSAAVSPVAGDQPEGDRVRSEDEVPTVWRPGDVILGLYEVKEVHEGGGMGLVYRVHHRGWNVDLAAKSPRPQFFATERHRENFEREAETWVNLGLHPHVVFCHYVRRLGGIPRVFAEYVAGGSLEQWIRSGRLYEGGPERALERILDIAIQLAWGLHHAHEQGLIHQDVKSANVMLTPEGLAKVTDFGLANARAESHEGGTPPPGQTLLASWGGMTPAYCSPEQAQIDHLRAAGVPRAEWPKLSRKTDLWSWAVTVLEMFVGEVAWGPGQLAGEWFSDGYPELDLEADLPRIPPGLSELMRRCFEREPQRRPGDMREVADTLKVLYEQVTHRPCSRPEPVAAMALADSLNNHAVSMLDLGKQDQAERLLEEALRADRNHVESTYNLGLIRWRTARTTDEVVLHQLREIGITAPGDWRIAYQIARIHLERDDCEAAVSTLEAISTPAAEREEIQAALTAGRDLLPMSRRCLYTLEGQTEEVISISLSGNGQSALSECDDNVARLRMMDIPRMDAGPVLQLLKEKMHRTLRLWAILLWVWALLLWEMIIGRRSHSDGYTAVVKAVSLSGDGRLALSISEDWTLRLWAVDTGRCLRSFEGFRWLVTSACLSYDGRLALTGGRDNKLRLWEVGSGRCLRSFVGHTGAVTSVCLSSDGRLALSGSSDETFRLWEADTGQCFRSFNGHMGLVTSVCLSGNVQLAMSGDLDHKLRLWEVNTGRCIRTFEGHTATLMSVCLSGNGRFALSADRNNKLRLWEVDTGRCLRSFEEPVNSFCLSQDGRYCLISSASGQIGVWDILGNLQSTPAPFELSNVVANAEALATASEIGQRLAEARRGFAKEDLLSAAHHLRKARSRPEYRRRREVVGQWHNLYTFLPKSDFVSGREERSFKDHRGPVASVCLSGDGRLALSGGLDRTLRLWEVNTGRCLRSFNGHTGTVTSVCLSSDDRHALSGSSDKTLRLWEVNTGRCLRSFVGHTGEVTSVCLTGDGRFVLSGSLDGWFLLWEVDTSRCLRAFTGHIGGMTLTKPRFDWFLALLMPPFGWALWVAIRRHAIRRHGKGVTSVCLSSDGQLALSGSWDIRPRLWLWEVHTGRCLRSFLSSRYGFGMTSGCLSNDGRFAISGGPGNKLRHWEVDSGRCLRSFVGHTGEVTSVCLSGDGRFALSGSRDNTLRLWEVASGRCLHSFDGHTGAVTSVCLSGDGRFALSGSDDETLRLWMLDWELEDRSTAEWDEGARPYLVTFLTAHTPYARVLSLVGTPSKKQVKLALTRQGYPSWTEEDFQRLLFTLGCVGYGWLQPEGVRRELEKMTANWLSSPALPKRSIGSWLWSLLTSPLLDLRP